MYRYTPPRINRKGTVLAAALMLSAVAMVLLSRIPLGHSGLNQLIGFVLAVAGIQITTRYCLTFYSYAVEGEKMGEEDAQPVALGEEIPSVLRIVRTQGKKSLTVGQFRLENVIAVEENLSLKEAEAKHGKCARHANFCNSIRPVRTAVVIAEANGEKNALILEPDDVILRVLFGRIGE